jgi:MoaA/NifB/PqqE/SkfB family radical SAM enzyme
MFKFEQLRSAHIEITSNCQASCPMCARNIHGGIVNPHLTIVSWKFEDYRRIFKEDVLKQMEFIRFSGNYGDPMLNDDLIDMVEYTTWANPNINLRIHTNGGARKPEWWSRLAKVMPEVHDIYFALDGLEDTHHLHRIGTRYETVIRNAKSFIDAGGNAVWIFLLFKHNQHQAEEVEKRARELGFARFVARKSLRFDSSTKFKVFDKDRNITHYLEPADDHGLKFKDIEYSKNYEKSLNDVIINCPVLQNKEIYIDAWQRVYPCCFLGIGAEFPVWNEVDKPMEEAKDIVLKHKKTTDQKIYYNKRVTDSRANDASVYSLEQILNGETWSSINWHKEYWGENKMLICAETCGEAPGFDLAKPNDQYYKRELLKSVNEKYDSDDKTRNF